MYNEEKRSYYVTLQWAAVAAAAARKIYVRTTIIQHHLDTLYTRHANNLINASELLTD